MTLPLLASTMLAFLQLSQPQDLCTCYFLPIFHLLNSCFGSWLKCHFCRENSPEVSLYQRDFLFVYFFKCTYLAAAGGGCSMLDIFDVVHGLNRCSARAPERRGSAAPPHVGSQFPDQGSSPSPYIARWMVYHGATREAPTRAALKATCSNTMHSLH